MENKPSPTVAADILAKLFEITPRRLQQLAKEGTLIREGRGQYPFLPNVRAYIRYLRAGAQPVEDIDPDRMEPFKRRAFYQGEREKIALREQAGELVPRLELEEELSFVVKTCVHAFETLTDTLERDANLTPQQAQLVEQACDQVRLALHERFGEPAATAVATDGAQA